MKLFMLYARDILLRLSCKIISLIILKKENLMMELTLIISDFNQDDMFVEFLLSKIN